ncbi:MAG: hypothetical protein ACPL0C_06110 [Candidatus Bathyarchaeales archaeon]
MKAEPAIIIAFTICIFLSFYFVYLSFQTTEETLKKELVTLAVYSLLSGVVVLACMTVYLGIRRILKFEQTQTSKPEQELAS